MSVTGHFASSLGRNSQLPNKELARQIVASNDGNAVGEIMNLISNSPNTDLLADALKVLEMIGEKKPVLASPAFDVVLPLLLTKVNKIQWRAMTVLSTIAGFHQHTIFTQLGKILEIMDQGSVITRDSGFKILVALYVNPTYSNELAPLMLEQILAAPDNQLGQYAEKWMKVIRAEHAAALTMALESRRRDLTHPSHQKRIDKILLKLKKK